MIHETACIDQTHGEVKIHDHAFIGPFAFIIGPVLIGPGVRVFPHVVIGCEGEHRNHPSAWSLPVTIGEDTTIRETTVIQRGISTGTIIDRDCYIMHGCHIPHDAVLEEDVTLSPGTTLGGSTRVMRGANLGIHSSTHQGVTIGSYAMLGMGAVCIGDLPPGKIAVGNPARIIGENAVGIERHLVDNAELWREQSRFDALRSFKRVVQEKP